MKRKIPHIAAAAIALLFLVLLTSVTFTLLFALRKKHSLPKDTDAVYIYVSQNDTETEAITKKDAWQIKDYNGKIGVFDIDGKLIQVIDTYVKTLPEVDRAEIEEGFWVNSEKELYSIIEAYSD
ncbi:MAG: hypothetical protein IJ011_08640 [Clostridia bacterium]|nr:hypothetical protein [Clostridia bacterium]